MRRRAFLQVCGIGAAGLSTLGLQARAPRGKAGVSPRNSARNLVLVHLNGAPSHLDTFDLKVGDWTPDDFAAGTFGNLNLPAGLFPNLVNHADKFSLLRCINGTEAVHSRAQYVLETCQTFNPTFAKEHPHVGSLLAYELDAARAETDLMPTFLAINARVQGPGMLASTFAAFPIDGAQGVPGLTHPDGEALFSKRYESLLAMDGHRSGEAAAGAVITDYSNFYTLAERMVYQPELEGVFDVTEEETARYGDSSVGAGCALAVKTLARDSGTRVVQVSHNGWDHHYDIYDKSVQNNLYSSCAQLDPALAAMLEDLAAQPGTQGGTLLDETLVVVTGEFGRTPGALTRNQGRDHYPGAWSAMVAGGGIIPNQAFGATDDEGAYITDRFWSQNHTITMNDLIATIYSSLGVDWTKEIQDTPSGRVYEYTPKYNGEAGYYTDIVEMFS